MPLLEGHPPFSSFLGVSGAKPLFLVARMQLRHFRHSKNTVYRKHGFLPPRFLLRREYLRAACLQNETPPEKLLNRHEKRFEKREKRSEKRSETRPKHS